MAEESLPVRRPNRVLAIVLLSLAALGTAALMMSSFYAFFHEHRGTGLWHLSFGVLWFLFFTWAARVSMRPFPPQ